MCVPSEQPGASAALPHAGAPGVPGSASEAMEMVLAGLGWLASADVASLPVVSQGELLRGLERAISLHTAARARALAAFTAQAGYEEDAHGSPRTWLKWQTRVTGATATAALAWARRLRSHPAAAEALAEGTISESWARQICDWTDQFPEDARADADVILLAAATAGADLADLASLADQIRRRVARPDRDRDDRFDDRGLRLAVTFGGAGRLYADLTPRCAAALQAVLDALGKRADREDMRSKAQRDHDALEEACRRLIGSGCLPDRAGQPTQISLHMELADLLALAWPGASADGGRPGQATVGQPGPDAPRPAWPGPAAVPGDECDAHIAPVVTGRVDHDLLGRLAASLASAWPASGDPGGGDPGGGDPGGGRPSRDPVSGAPGGDDPGGGPGSSDQDGPAGSGGRSLAAVRELLLRHAVALLSGPGGLASILRTGALPPPAGSVSLPLDVGAVTDTIPPHLRRAVIVRDRQCAAPGCDQPPVACDVHHIVPRARGGATKLANLVLLCRFHHLIFIHQWGWAIVLNADGTTTVTSPDGARQYRSHAPPASAA